MAANLSVTIPDDFDFESFEQHQMRTVVEASNDSGSTTAEIIVNLLDRDDTPEVQADEFVFASVNHVIEFGPDQQQQISLVEVDPSESAETVFDISVNAGQLTAPNADSNALTTFNGDGSSSIRMEGWLEDINLALVGLLYTPLLNADDDFDFNVEVKQSNGWEDSVISVRYNAPIITRPTVTQTVDEDTDLVFSTAGGNAITLADADAADSLLELALSVNNGTLILGATAGVTVESGADSSAAMTVRGTLSDLNAALEGLAYRGDQDWNGADVLPDYGRRLERQPAKHQNCCNHRRAGKRSAGAHADR